MGPNTPMERPAAALAAGRGGAGAFPRDHLRRMVVAAPLSAHPDPGGPAAFAHPAGGARSGEIRGRVFGLHRETRQTGWAQSGEPYDPADGELPGKAAPARRCHCGLPRPGEAESGKSPTAAGVAFHVPGQAANAPGSSPGGINVDLSLVRGPRSVASSQLSVVRTCERMP